MVYKFFDKKTSARYAWSETLAGSGIKNENISNKELTKELHKSIIRKSEKRKVDSSFIANIRSTHFADIYFYKTTTRSTNL